MHLTVTIELEADGAITDWATEGGPDREAIRQAINAFAKSIRKSGSRIVARERPRGQIHFECTPDQLDSVEGWAREYPLDLYGLPNPFAGYARGIVPVVFPILTLNTSGRRRWWAVTRSLEDWNTWESHVVLWWQLASPERVFYVLDTRRGDPYSLLPIKGA